MTRPFIRVATLAVALAVVSFTEVATADEPTLRIGIIGCDTSHTPAFTKFFNTSDPAPELAGMRVVAAFPGGSDDIPDSIGRVPQYTEELKGLGVEIVDSIPALLEKVDVVMLESLDGRKHLPQARPVIEAGKPLFIDKPLSGTLAEAVEIFRLAKEKKVPCFSSSSLRYQPKIANMRNNEAIGDVLGCDAFSPCALEPHHPDFFWYGVHGVEILFTIMGPGCQSVSRTQTPDGEFAVGVWKDGRIGTFRGTRTGAHSYGAMVFGSKSIQPSGGFEGYQYLAFEIAKFFRSGQPPVAADETIEIFAFMQAADESKKQNGRPVNVPELIEQARKAGVPAAQAGPVPANTAPASPQSATVQQAGTWKAGTARIVITPERPMVMGGYASRTQPAQDKLSELEAKALALEDADGHRSVLVTLDVVGVARQFSVDVCRRIEKEHGLPRASVALAVSHNHCGPLMAGNLVPMMVLDQEQSQLVESYSATLSDRVVRLVGDALHNLAPAQLSWGSGTATFAVNRRNNKEPEVPQLRTAGRLAGPSDYDVPVLKITDAAGLLKAMVFGYACHATVLNTPVWSADYPGAAERELERMHPGAVALFWAGCGADQNALPRLKEPFVEIYGRQLAYAVDAVLTGPTQPLGPKLEMTYQEIDLPFAQLPARDELAETAKASDFQGRRAKLLLAAWDRDGKLSPTYPYPVQLWRLGSQLDWAFLGGEVVVDYALRLKRAAAPEPLWVTAYANDVMAYIPSRRVLEEGGYEGATAMVYYGLPSPWDRSVEERIVDAVEHERAELAAVR
jgi:predicted dehydrogenase